MNFRILRVLLLSFLFVFSRWSHAADAYHDYVADIYLLESYQARQPKQIIRYSEGDKGVLLQSVLESKRLNAALNVYWASTKRGESLTDITKILQPLMVRYDNAFKNAPRVYEMEYLDSLEALIELMSAGSSMSVASVQAPGSTKAPKIDAKTQQALSDSAQALAKAAREINAMVLKAFGTRLRSQVAQNLFTELGAKRALAIAERVAPPAQP